MNHPEAPKPPHRRFKGVWISASIWDDPELSPTEKFLIAEIDSLCGKDEDTGEEHACYAGNEHLAARLHVSGSHMRDMLSDLTTSGYIVRLFFTGRVTYRCINPDLSSDPGFGRRLIKRYASQNRYRKNPIAGIGQNRQQTSEKSDTEIPSRVTKKETTTSATPDLFTNGHRPKQVVVAVSCVASEEDSPREISDKLTEEFGLSIPQGREVETHLASKGAGYVIEKAEIVRNKKAVKNMAGAFMKALSDDWKAPKSISSGKPVKKTQQAEPENPEPQLSFEERKERLAATKAAVSTV